MCAARTFDFTYQNLKGAALYVAKVAAFEHNLEMKSLTTFYYCFNSVSADYESCGFISFNV